MRKVELATAFSWWCDTCSELNFVMPCKAELTDDDAEEAYRAFHMLEDFAELPEGWRDFELVERPKVVKCTGCGSQFETEDESRC